MGFEYQNNIIKLPFSPPGGYSLVEATYTITELSISDGQDPEKKNKVGDVKHWSGPNGSITFQVGRHLSDKVSNWWIERISPSENTFNANPKGLNFAFLGKMDLKITGGILGSNTKTYTLENVGIAQGHSGSANNWWFGSKTGQYSGDNTVRVTGKEGFEDVYFWFKRGDGNEVDEVKLVKIGGPSDEA